MNDLEDGNSDFEVLIKIEICKIFHKILDISEDFLLNNFLSYFTQEFLKLKILNENKEISDNTEDLLKLLPNTIKEITNIKEPINKENTLVQHFKQGTNIVLDDMIGRPFIEVVLISFYF